MELTTQDAQELVSIIRTVAQQEIADATENIEYAYFGIVSASYSDITYDVEIPSEGSIYPNLYNKTGTTLTVGDAVIVHAKDNNFGNAYIAVKNGYTEPGGGGGTTYTLPVATSTVLGGVKSGTDITVDASGNVSVVDDSHNHIISNIDGLQTALDGKVDDSQVLTNVPVGALFTDTVYTHPTNHPPSIISQDSSNRFVTDAEKSTWNNKQDALGYTPLDSALKGSINGLAELDENGKVPSTQLPSYVDDVLEYVNIASFPATGESGKIYVAIDTNLTYRWTGSIYVEISQSLALGETSTTAYRGDRGKIAYDHSQTPHAIGEAGMITQPTYTDNGDGTVTIGSATARIFSTSDFTNGLKEYAITGGTYSFSDDIITYIVVNYNSGSPQYQVITNQLSITESDIIPVFTLYKHNNVIRQLNWDTLGHGLPNKIHQRLVHTDRFHVENGLTLSESATRKIIVSAGVIWYGAISLNAQACDSSVSGTCRLISHVAGLDNFSTITQYNNTQYDDGTNLQSLTTNHYGINWVYRSVEENPKTYIVLGASNYVTLSSAISALPRADVSNVIKSNCMLVGRIIVRMGEDTATQIDNIANSTPNYANVPSHNNLTELQGGTAGEYYHLNSANYTDLTDGTDSVLHYHSTDRNRSNHTGTQSADTIVDGTTNKVLTSTMKTNYDNAVTNSHTHSNKSALDLVSGTNTGNETTTTVGNLINVATEKTTPIDTDMFALMDSNDSNIMKKISFANLKSSIGSGSVTVSSDVNVAYVYMYYLDGYATEPTVVNDSWCYFNSTDNKAYKYNGSAWVDNSIDENISIFFNNTDKKIYSYNEATLVFGDITEVINDKILVQQYISEGASLSTSLYGFYNVTPTESTSISFKNKNIYIPLIDIHFGETNMASAIYWWVEEEQMLIPISISGSTIVGAVSEATKLETARTINGISFDGTQDIVITDDTKAPLSSPAFADTPTAPTATTGTNTTQLATTAFVQQEISASGGGGGGIADSIVNTNNTSQSLSFWSGTQAQYDAIVTKDDNTLYFVI